MFSLVPPVGLEPTTFGLKVRRKPLPETVTQTSKTPPYQRIPCTRHHARTSGCSSRCSSKVPSPATGEGTLPSGAAERLGIGA